MLSYWFMMVGCTFGLRPLEPIPNPDELDIDTPDESDSDTDTDADTDTDSDTDADTDSDYVENLITDISPRFGPTTGGTTVSIDGGPFTSDATVSIGGYEAPVLSNNGSTIRVTTPVSSESIPAEVRVSLTNSFGISPTPFYYFEDGNGLTGAIGEVGIIELVGDYWTGSSGVQNGFFSVAFTNPVDFQWWEFTSGSLDSCSNAASFSYTGDAVEVLDMGTNSITVQQGATPLILPRGSSNSADISYFFYQTDGLTTTDLIENAYYDLNPLTGDLEGLSVPQFARFSKRVIPTSPNIDSINIPSVSATQTFLWAPSGASWIQIRMYQIDTANNIVSDINCNAIDDGQFTVTNVHSQWTPGDVVYIQFYRMYEGETTMQHNNSVSRVVGEYIVVGAGIMN